MSEISEYSGMFIQTLRTLKGCGVSIYGHVHNSYGLHQTMHVFCIQGHPCCVCELKSSKHQICLSSSNGALEQVDSTYFSLVT